MFLKFLKLDWILIFSVLFLMATGLISLYSISSAGASEGMTVFSKQLLFSFLGITAMFFFAFSNHNYLNLSSRWIYFFALISLFLVLFFGTEVRGTSGWVGIAEFRIQPVEFAKIAIVIFMASFISKKKLKLGEMERLLASLVLTAAAVFLVIKQPDFGSAMVIAVTWVGMVLVSGVSRKSLVSIILVACVAVVASWMLFAPYQKARIKSFLDPTADPRGSGYNVKQSIIAVGSGGLKGKGIGHGSQSQLNFLPEKHTDFIFAVISEELGILGSSLVIFLYGVILYRVKKIAQWSSDNFGYLLASGFMVMIFAQVTVNIAMNIGFFPVTGIPLPFLSYGGSSLISLFIAIGILLDIYSRKDTSKYRSIHSY